MNLIQHFDRVYFINLPERTDRRQALDAELAQHGLQIDQERLRIFRGFHPDHAEGFPNAGAHGCFLSHLAIIEEALATGLDSVLICEDDVELSHHTDNALGPLLWTLCAENWDFAYLGHCEAFPPGIDQAHWGYSRQALNTTHCYALSRQILPRLRDYLRACLNAPEDDGYYGRCHIDEAYSRFRAQRQDSITLLAMPSLAAQRPSRSDVHRILRERVAPWFRQLGHWLQLGTSSEPRPLTRTSGY